MTTQDINRRLARIEKTVKEAEEPGQELLIQCLKLNGYEAVREAMEAPNEPFAYVMTLFDDVGGPEAFEGYRKLVPDAVIEAAYRRQWRRCLAAA
jgi:hypothetical protein